MFGRYVDFFSRLVNYFVLLLQILSARGVPIHYIDATNPSDGNILRFIRWTHDKSQQNVVCMQQNQQIHYFSMRVGLVE